jgi:PAS domain S-box-containing protein
MGGRDGPETVGDEAGDRYRRILELLPLPLALVGPDDTPTWVNAEFGRLFGPGPGEAGGVADWPEGLFRDARDRARRLSEAERGGAGDDPPVTLHATARDGSVRPVHLRLLPLIDGERVALLEDISEHRRAAVELEKTQALLLAAIEQSPAGILIADAPDVRIRVANSAALGIRGESLLPLTEIPVDLHPEHWQTFHPDGAPYAGEKLPLSRAILEGRTTRNEEVIIRRPNGEERWVSANAAPVKDGEGKIVAGVVVFPDITELKRAEKDQERLEAQMRHTQKLESLGVLAGGVAHDFNNLLMGMLGNADLALLKLPPDSAAAENLASIRDSSQRAADLCRQLLAYSGRGQVAIEPLDLCRVVREMTQLLEISAAKKAVLEYELPSSLPTFNGDRSQIQQVILNLVTNAAEAGDEGQRLIRIQTGSMDCDREFLMQTVAEEELPEGRYVWLEVTDSGEGMDAETLPRIFDPFFTRKFPGRGLGLAAVAGILRGHKGAIHVQSEPGRGTIFRVLFPAVRSAEQPARPKRTKKGAGKISGTVLIVDDEEAVLSVGQRMLEQIGLTVFAVLDGAGAVELFRERAAEIDAVLLDLTMPGMDGEETLRALRAVSREVPVILASGYSDREVSRRFGADEQPEGFLQKPFTVATLADKLREFLGS